MLSRREAAQQLSLDMGVIWKNIQRLFRKCPRPLLAEELHLSQETPLKGSVNKTVVLPLSPASWWECYLDCRATKCPCSKFWTPSLSLLMTPCPFYFSRTRQVWREQGLQRAGLQSVSEKWVQKEKQREKAEEGRTCTQWELGQSSTSKQMDSFLGRRGIFCWFFGGDCFVGLGFFTGLSHIFAVL